MEVYDPATGQWQEWRLPGESPQAYAVYVDDRVMALAYVILGSGNRSSKVRIGPAALERLPGVRVVAGLAHPLA